jgi:4-hydroxybenzoyl-CoA reductase subunit beta
MIAERIYCKPKSIAEALSMAMDNADDFRYLAGGTDVIINKFQGNSDTNCLIDITGILELKSVTVEGNMLRIGALVKLDDLKKNQIIQQKFPTLLIAAHAVASPMLRKTATIGGNILCENRCIFYNQSEWWREAVGYCLKCDGDICIATGGKKACFSKFVSDTAPVLICCDAQIEIAHNNEIHSLPLESIYTGDGIKPRNLDKLSLVTGILLPLDNNYKCVFMKLRPRESVDYSSLTTAVSINKNGRIKIALGGVDPKPVVTESASIDNRDELIARALRKSRVIDNDVYSRAYRRDMIKVYLNRSFDELLNK